MLPLVLSLDRTAADPPGPEELTAAARRLAGEGFELVPEWAGAEHPPTPEAQRARARAILRRRPRPWWEWDRAVECRDLDEVVRLVGGLPGLAAELLAVVGGKAEAALRERVGPCGASGPVWLFGAGLVGRQVAGLMAAQGRPAAGFLDNDAGLRGATVDGLPVLKPEDAARGEATVVICTGRHHEDILAQLARLGVRPLSLPELTVLLGLPAEPERGYAADLAHNAVRYLGLAARLADDRSRVVLAAVLRHRVTLASEPLRSVCTGDQWFVPEVFRADPEARYADGGAYDGDSAAEFVRRNAGPGRVLDLFEPDEDLCGRAEARFDGWPQVRVHRAGLGARAGTGSYTPTGGMDGAFGENGRRLVPIVSLDDALSRRATYIKLDVEGAEEAALNGARLTILASRPVLAVAVYHRAADLWRLPAWIDSLNAGYRLYLRHHTQLQYETVAYAAV